jgi:peptidoglycan/LPS O-acetylase OafA/YrhL
LVQDQASATPASVVLHDERATEYLSELNSVRGLAALSVAVFHSAHVIPVDGNRRVYLHGLNDLDSLTTAAMRLIMVVFSGGAAVSMFFVLSGFVLMLSMMRDQRPPIPASVGFVGRRVSRIYPALAVNILAMAMVMGLPFEKVFENLSLMKNSVNGASWSLFVEMFAIPLLLATWMITRLGGSAGLFAVLALSVAALFTNSISRGTVLGSFWFMFAFGMAAAWWRTERLSASPIAILFALTALLSARLLMGYGSRWSLLVEAIASTYIVAALAFARPTSVHKALRTRPFDFLGKTSYSFYLYHPLALSVMVPPLVGLHVSVGPVVAALIISLATIVVALPLAWLSFVIVEVPFMKLGRRL